LPGQAVHARQEAVQDQAGEEQQKVQQSRRQGPAKNKIEMSYLTQEDRKEMCTHHGNYYTFHYVRDLSEDVHIYHKQPMTFVVAKERLAADVMQFTAMWMLDTFTRLNGFPGIDTVRFIVP
jgi:hypothetical protein